MNSFNKLSTAFAGTALGATPQASTLDRLVVGSSQLMRGKIWLEKLLGVALTQYYCCDALGTHGYQLQLSNNCAVELIAINPDAKSAQHPRPFGLDTTDVAERIAIRPRLIGWVARTEALDKLHAATGEILGAICNIDTVDARNFLVKSRITIPNEGYPIEGGLIPHMLEYGTCANMPAAENNVNNALKFTWMEAAHPNPAKVQYLLSELGLGDTIVLASAPPYSGMSMCAYIDTPNGTKTLMS